MDSYQASRPVSSPLSRNDSQVTKEHNQQGRRSRKHAKSCISLLRYGSMHGHRTPTRSIHHRRAVASDHNTRGTRTGRRTTEAKRQWKYIFPNWKVAELHWSGPRQKEQLTVNKKRRSRSTGILNPRTTLCVQQIIVRSWIWILGKVQHDAILWWWDFQIIFK